MFGSLELCEHVWNSSEFTLESKFGWVLCHYSTRNIGEVVALRSLLPGNPGNFLFLSHRHLDLALEFNSELSVGGVVDSGVVSLRALLGSDLSEYGRRLFEVLIELDLNPSSSNSGFASLDHSSVKEFVGTFFNDHVRDSLFGMVEVEI